MRSGEDVLNLVYEERVKSLRFHGKLPNRILLGRDEYNAMRALPKDKLWSVYHTTGAEEFLFNILLLQVRNRSWLEVTDAHNYR
jgi:hypothetical protein